MLFNEPKLLKFRWLDFGRDALHSFSALQRAEIAEIVVLLVNRDTGESFSALQRAEIAEIYEQLMLEAGTGVFQCSSTSRNC